MLIKFIFVITAGNASKVDSNKSVISKEPDKQFLTK